MATGFEFTAAGFGILMSLFNAAISAVENIHERRDRFRNCGIYLRGHVQDVEICQAAFEVCVTELLAEGEFVAKDDFDQFVGAGKYQTLVQQVHLIRQSMARLQCALTKGFQRCDISEGPADSTTFGLTQEETTSLWTSWLSLANLPKPRQAPPPMRVRLSYTFLRAPEWAGRVKNLKDEIAKLQSFIGSAAKSKKLPKATSAANSLGERLRAARQIEQHWVKFSDVMEALSTSQFRVLLRAPDEAGHVSCLSSERDIVTDLLYEMYGDDGSLEYRKIVHVSRYCAEAHAPENLVKEAGAGGLRDSLLTVTPEAPRERGSDLLSWYRLVSQLDDPGKRELYRKKWEREALETALGLIAWCLLLWNTPWADSISTCKLWRFSKVTGCVVAVGRSRDANTSDCSCHMWHQSNASDAPILLKCNGQHCHASNENARRQWLQSRLLVLGITLCEMALALPLTIQIAEGGVLRFWQRGESLDQQQLLNRVCCKQGISYRKAVEKCFKYGLQPNRSLATAQDILEMSEDILVPLEKWQQALDARDHRSKVRQALATLLASEADELLASLKLQDSGPA